MEQLDMPSSGGGAFISGVAVMIWCVMSFAVVLISWALGGSEYKDSIFGNVALVTCVAGFIGGSILCRWARHQGYHE